jgi:hypothetical protein
MGTPLTPSKKHVLTNKKMDTSPSVSVHTTAIDTSTWLTRNEASDVLSCSQGTLFNYERRGMLHPQRAYRVDGRGVDHHLVVYNPDELRKLGGRMKRSSARDPGEVAAHAFELFHEEKTLAAIVIELRVTPETVERFHEKWLDMGEARFMISPVTRKALEALVGPFNSVADLVEQVAKLKPAV